MRDALDAQERIPPEVEEIVVDAHTIHPEKVSPYSGQCPLNRGGRCAVGYVQVGAFDLGNRKGLAVDLPAGRAGQLLHLDEGGRDHVVRKQQGKMLAQFIGVNVALRGEVAHEPLHTGTILAHAGHRLEDSGMLLKGHLDLTEFDAIPTHLDLPIDASFVVEVPVG